MNPKTSLVVSCIFITWSGSVSGTVAKIKPSDIRPERELLITHPAVVDSDAAKYPGAWSFGGLAEELLGKDHASEAIRHWLDSFYWDSNPGSKSLLPARHDPLIWWLSLRFPTAFDFTARRVPQRIPGRAGIASKVVKSWQEQDGYDPTSEQPWKPNLANAPFRLLAIVNRMDLAGPRLASLEDVFEKRRRNNATRMGGYGGGAVAGPPPNFGEGRLIFGAIDSTGQPLEGGWTLIFEYKLTSEGIPAPLQTIHCATDDQSLVTARRWAQAWHALGQLELGSDCYNEALETVTRAFTHHKRKADGTSERAPHFAQIRTNDGAFGPGRQFRQFGVLENRFVAETLPMTPAPGYLENAHAGSRLLSALLQQNEAQIRAGNFTLPEEVPDRGKMKPMLASHATIPPDQREFHWEPIPRLRNETRRQFSLNTCNGCHAAETNCADGLHVHPRRSGETSKLSTFLRMDGLANRFQDPGLKTSWIQQREMEDRAAILAALLQPKEARQLDGLNDTLKERMRRAH